MHVANIQALIIHTSTLTFTGKIIKIINYSKVHENLMLGNFCINLSKLSGCLTSPCQSNAYWWSVNEVVLAFLFTWHHINTGSNTHVKCQSLNAVQRGLTHTGHLAQSAAFNSDLQKQLYLSISHKQCWLEMSKQIKQLTALPYPAYVIYAISYYWNWML